MLRAPSMQDLDPRLAALARALATRLAARGHRAWIVGGAVRDLALGRAPKDVDLCSAATPDEVEAAFERTIPLGRAFGTVVVHVAEGDAEHTTFRSEHGHADARHPDQVAFGASVEEDARRRDFTCNALYLDPLTGEVRDPTGGLDDLRARRIACVGDPSARFAEDGLRLVRLARFAAGFALEPDARTLAAACASSHALRGVSRERVLLELHAVFARTGAGRFLELLESAGLLDLALPGFDGLRPASLARDAWIAGRVRLLASLAQPAGIDRGLAALLAPELGQGGRAALERSLALLDDLKPSRELRAKLAQAWTLQDAFEREQAPTRATRLRWMQRPAFPLALDLGRAWRRARGTADDDLAALAREFEALGPGGAHPPKLVLPADLAARGIAPGPEYGEILHEAETRVLDLELTTRDEALAWLERRLQEGGNTLRSPRASG